MLFPQFYVFFPNYPNLHKLTLSIFLHTIDLSLVWYKVTVYNLMIVMMMMVMVMVMLMVVTMVMMTMMTN